LVLTSGCEIQLEAPAASGTVLDSKSLAPIPDAFVIRHIDFRDRKTHARTDKNGHFKFGEAKRLAIGCSAANEITYRVEAPGYATFTNTMYGGGVFSGGEVPHDLGRIMLAPK